ncbi:MAG: hypothetical protein K0U37_03095 [Gammaproteobacteria bacterium]|nr:hypothetical protein [Gammaproteobacteria bacterium]
MKLLLKGFLISLFFSCVAIASEGTTTEEAATSNEILFQVVEQQIVFNNQSIETAKAIPPKTENDFYGIELRLKPAAAKQFEKLTQNNMGKSLNIVLNNNLVSSSIIQSSLGEQFIIAGLTRDQATRFVEDIRHEHED